MKKKNYYSYWKWNLFPVIKTQVFFCNLFSFFIPTVFIRIEKKAFETSILNLNWKSIVEFRAYFNKQYNRYIAASLVEPSLKNKKLALFVTPSKCLAIFYDSSTIQILWAARYVTFRNHFQCVLSFRSLSRWDCDLSIKYSSIRNNWRIAIHSKAK